MSDSTTVGVAEEKELGEEEVEPVLEEGIPVIEPDDLDDTDFAAGDDLGDEVAEEDEEVDDAAEEGSDGVWSSI